MANDYRSFSSAIADLTPEEHAWLVAILGAIPRTFGGGGDVAPLRAVCDRLGIQMPTDAEYFPDFQWSIEDATFEREGPPKKMLWMYAEHDFDANHVAWLAQAFLRRFRPHDWFSIEWADTCSKPRIGCFGGGAVFVTAEGARFLSTARWVADRRTEFAATVPHEVATYNERSPFSVLPPGAGD